MLNPFEALQQLDKSQQIPEIEDYLDHLCHPLVERMSYDEREIIRAEMRAHIVGLVQAHRELGSSETDAIAAALSQFGDPITIGSSVLREHRTSRRLASPALWIVTNLALGAAIGSCVMLSLDCLTNVLHLTMNICPGPDCVIGAVVGWIPALTHLKRPGLASAARFAKFYGFTTGGLILFAALASGSLAHRGWSALVMTLTAIAGSIVFGATAGIAFSHAQSILAKYAPKNGKYLRRSSG